MIKFVKAHAHGNDFLYVRKADIAHISIAEQPSLARDMCDRHAGVGADGLIVYERTPAGATMTLWNADGSRAEVSGNGVRALAALLLQGDEHPAAPVAIRPTPA